MKELIDLRKENAELKLKLEQKESEMHYILAQVVEHLPNPIVLTDFNSRITYVNKSLESHTGYTRAELMNEPVVILNAEKNAEKIQEDIYNRLRSGEVYDKEIIQRRKDGSSYLGDFLIFPIYNDDTIPIAWASVQQDITKRKQAECTLHQHAHFLQTLLETIPNPVFFKDTDGLYLGCNPAFEEWVGLPKEKVMGRSVYDIWPITTANVLKTMDDELISKIDTQVYETTIPHQDGSERNVVFYKSTYVTGGNDSVVGVVGLIVDITESKRTERMLWDALEEAKQRATEITAFLESTSAISNQQDFKDTAKANLEACLKLIEAPIGYIRLYSEDSIDNDFLLIDNGNFKCGIDPSTPIPIRGLPAQACKTGKVVYDNDFANSKWFNCLPDGHVNVENVLLAPMVCKNKPKGMIGLGNKPGGFNSNDVKIATVFAEHTAIALQNSQLLDNLILSVENYRTIFNAVNDAIILHEMETGKIIDANKKACQLYGCTHHELCSLNVADIIADVPPYTMDNATTLMRRASRGEPLLFEWLGKDKSGEHLWVEVNLKSAVIQGKKYLLAVTRNISERKKMEQEMARLDRLNLVGQMAAGIGHEVRNPMTTVRGFLQMFQGKKELTTYKKYMDLMIEELDRANSIITQFLSLAKDKPVEKKMMNLTNIIVTIFPLIQAEVFKSNLYSQLELSNIPDLLVDEKEIRQLILNLVRNGLEEMEVGKTLTIKTFTEANEVILAVSDQGKGIEPAILDKLGTPFLTTKDEGTGLGLAVCFSIAARHNASIDVETSSEGSTFFVRFKLTNWER
ncbi:MAG: PAS domain S-box protein [Firmicutes bacterium]|nr:PAS domain S-box protein [Bacillota bacterium]